MGLNPLTRGGQLPPMGKQREVADQAVACTGMNATVIFNGVCVGRVIASRASICMPRPCWRLAWVPLSVLAQVGQLTGFTEYHNIEQQWLNRLLWNAQRTRCL